VIEVVPIPSQGPTVKDNVKWQLPNAPSGDTLRVLFPVCQDSWCTKFNRFSLIGHRHAIGSLAVIEDTQSLRLDRLKGGM